MKAYWGNYTGDFWLDGPYEITMLGPQPFFSWVRLDWGPEYDNCILFMR